MLEVSDWRACTGIIEKLQCAGSNIPDLLSPLGKTLVLLLEKKTDFGEGMALATRSDFFRPNLYKVRDPAIVNHHRPEVHISEDLRHRVVYPIRPRRRQV